MVLNGNRTNPPFFTFFCLLIQVFISIVVCLLLFCFFVFFFDQIGLIHNECDRLHNENNEEYANYNRKIDGYCGLLCFEILIRYSMAPQRACSTNDTFTGTIKLDVIQDTKWYDNLLSQRFEDYEKSEKNINLAARVKKSLYKKTSMFYKPYGMKLAKCEESIKYFENTIEIAPKWKNYQYYDLTNSLNFNNNNNNNNDDGNNQNTEKQWNLF